MTLLARMRVSDRITAASCCFGFGGWAALAAEDGTLAHSFCEQAFHHQLWDCRKLLVTTLDPLVEHGVQQIRHLDNYVDNLVSWLCDVRPTGRVEIDWRIGLAA
jgi:hypothetical protein